MSGGVALESIRSDSSGLLIVMTGLPGTGKSTLSRAAAERLQGACIDKDVVRAAIFPPEYIEYSDEQDNLCIELMLKAASFILARGRTRYVFIDGRCFTTREQRHQVTRYANERSIRVLFVHCVCSDETAIARIEADSGHPARNRDRALYERLKARFEHFDGPNFTVDTERSVEICVAELVRDIVRLE